MNYRGILIIEGQYRAISHFIDNKAVIFLFTELTGKDAEEEIERIWFFLGYAKRINLIVIRHANGLSEQLISSGLVCDLSAVNLPSSPRGIFDLFHETIFGWSTRVRLCNNIRDALADRSTIRWVGAELESLFNEKIHFNAVEISGNRILGRAFQLNGGFVGEFPTSRYEPHISKIFDHFTENYEPGQAKLGLLMSAVPQRGYGILYIGGSPGTAWID